MESWTEQDEGLMRRLSTHTTAVLLAVMIGACPDAVPPEAVKAQTITFPGGIPPEDFKAQVEVEASPEQVWAVLTDFSSYSIWNPFIYPAKGDPRPGTTLEITIHPGTRSITYQATVVAAQPNHELAWSGRISSSGVFDSTYTFTIEPLQAGRVRLISRETHKGLVVVLAWGLIKDIQSGLDVMTKAARNRAELERLMPRR